MAPTSGSEQNLRLLGTVIEKLGLSVLHLLPPEGAHDLSLAALRAGIVPLPGKPISSPRLRTSFAGLNLENPIGLAAGFDKNGLAIRPLMKAGFGFLELGAATPQPQLGNLKPRLFRLQEDMAVINRFGFNNDGAAVIGARMAARPAGIPVGLNIGANKASDDRAADYAEVTRQAGEFADFLTINVSSPNTDKLRDLQGPDALAALIDGVQIARNALTGPRRPIFVKISPDLDDRSLADLSAVAMNARIDGIIGTNTTTRRENLMHPQADEVGGLSGRPLMTRSTHILSALFRLTGGKIPLIGVGGVSSPADAIAKIEAGASAIQLYSALVYHGLSLVKDIAAGLDQYLERNQITLEELRGRTSQHCD